MENKKQLLNTKKKCSNSLDGTCTKFTRHSESPIKLKTSRARAIALKMNLECRGNK